MRVGGTSSSGMQSIIMKILDVECLMFE